MANAKRTWSDWWFGWRPSMAEGSITSSEIPKSSPESAAFRLAETCMGRDPSPRLRRRCMPHRRQMRPTAVEESSAATTMELETIPGGNIFRRSSSAPKDGATWATGLFYSW